MKAAFPKIRFYSILSVFVLLHSMGVAQFVTINSSNIFVVGSCPIYFNGANTPWQNWNDFGGTYNSAFWSSEFARLKASGINSTRIWITCNGAGQPSINGSGVTTAVSAQFWSNCDDMFNSARNNGIYVMATMMSFDHTKNGNPNATNWQNMLNSQTNVQTFVNTFIVPFVNRYKTNPYLWSIDACNEIEWIYENRVGNGDGSQWAGATYPILQRYVAMVAAGVHNNPRSDGTSVLVTVGSASTKWNGTMMRNGNNGSGWVTNTDGNKWNDVALKAQYNQANAILDFYSPHYYGWMYGYYASPFDRTVSQYGMNDKAVVIGEMVSVANLPTPGMPILTAFNNMKTGGYQGHFPWTSNLASTSSELGTLTDFGPASLSFKNANPTLVIPPASCSLPLSFLEITTSKEGAAHWLHWSIASEGVEYATFIVYGSKEGVIFNEIGMHTFVRNQSDYSFLIENGDNRYFYVQCLSNEASMQLSKIIEVGSSPDRWYSIYYLEEGNPILQLYGSGKVEVKFISYSGEQIHSEEYVGASTIVLKNYTKSEGLYIVQLNSYEKYSQQKVVVK